MLLKAVNPIDFTQGDNPTISLIATDDQGNPFDLTGAVFTTVIEGVNGAPLVSIPNAQHTADPDQVNNTGVFTIAFLSADTLLCGVAAYKDILTQAVIGPATITFRGAGILTVYPPVPTQ